MTIEDILNLTGGTLQNEPEIQAIKGATAYPSKVEHGDLFFAANNGDIASAIENGAYAVIYQGQIEPSDTEIAWIKVESVQKAAFKLLRYVLLKKEGEFYLLSPHEMSMLRQILTHKGNIVFLAAEWNKAFEQILNSSKYLFVSTNEKLLRDIKPEYKKPENEAEGYIVSDTLFRTTFRVEKYIYQDKELIPFHLPHLLRVVHFCQQHQLPYSLDKLRYTKHFLPVYINGRFEAVPRGASDRVLIFVDNLEDIVQAREYIRHQNSWVKSIVLTPPKTKIENVERPHWFETAEEAIEILKRYHFNYAFIYSLDKEVLKSLRNEQGSRLF